MPVAGLSTCRSTSGWKTRSGTPGTVKGMSFFIACLLAVGLLSGPGSPTPDQRCAQLAGSRAGGLLVTTATVNTSGTFTVPDDQGGRGEDPPGTVYKGLPAYCAVEAARTHPVPNDPMHITVWLPLSTWNGRFQGVGGGGFVGGFSYRMLTAALRAGYAGATTDSGHPASQDAGQFALTADGSLNTASISDFADRAIHDMTVAGKQLTTRFCRHAARYTYFNGCSQGGRQGLVEAQHYPGDYDGIVSGAPAMDFPQLSAMQLWPQVAMHLAGDTVAPCKFGAFQAAAIARCDPLDGLRDGLISDVAACRFDPRTLIGTATPCGTITAADATVMRQILQGPRGLWYGLEPGATANLLTSAPFYVATGFERYWVTQDPSFDWSTLTLTGYRSLFRRGVAKFPNLESDSTDLRAFRAAGGKLVLWAGLADPVIPPQQLIRYYRRLGPADAYARLFLAPGVGHCTSQRAGAYGPIPVDPLAAVTGWVEHGTAPVSLPAAEPGRTRPVCRYPLLAQYNGSGDPDAAGSFHCAARR
jgi:pimeloyl-ACP methyl ester carboxylesterase